MEPIPIVPIEPAARENLIRLAEAYCKATGNESLRKRGLSTIGRYVHSDPRFFTNLIDRHKKWIKQGKPHRVEDDRKGSVTFRVYDKMIAWFHENWPAGAEFPPLHDLKHSQENHHGKITKAPETARPEQSQSASAALARLRQR